MNGYKVPYHVRFPYCRLVELCNFERIIAEIIAVVGKDSMSDVFAPDADDARMLAKVQIIESIIGKFQIYKEFIVKMLLYYGDCERYKAIFDEMNDTLHYVISKDYDLFKLGRQSDNIAYLREIMNECNKYELCDYSFTLGKILRALSKKYSLSLPDTIHHYFDNMIVVRNDANVLNFGFKSQ